MDRMPRIGADWFDGRSARARPVEVWIDGATLHFDDHGEPLSGVTWPERQRHGQRQILLPGGGLLSFADAAAFDAWALASGRTDSVVVRWQQSWRLAVLSLVLLVAGLAIGYRWGLPWAVDHAVDALPPAVEQRLSAQLLASLDGEWLHPTTLSAAQQQAWRERWQRMLAQARTAGGPALPARYEIHFRAGSKALGPNAFALPGGDVVITDALLKLLEDEPDAVLTVLAHELGHVQHRHGMRALVQVALIGAATSVVIGDFSSLLAGVPALLGQLDYSRQAEREADHAALALLRTAHVSPQVMLPLFERLAAHRPAQRDLPLALSSHPADEERMAFFRNAAP